MINTHWMEGTPTVMLVRIALSRFSTHVLVNVQVLVERMASVMRDLLCIEVFIFISPLVNRSGLIKKILIIDVYGT